MAEISSILDLIESHAPSGTAESWDNVGLLLGDPAWTTSKAVVAIDLTEAAIRRARRSGARLIVCHHPCIFPKDRGLARVVAEPSHPSGLAFAALRAGIAVIACHTNHDRSALESSLAVARALGARPVGRLLDRPSSAWLKLSVFVPLTHLAKVRDAVTRAGAGQIGNYDSCTFSTEGMGTFRGLDDTHPFIGKPGEFESAREARLETILPRGLEIPVLQALRSAHPYEEIAYDLYPVEQAPPSVGLVRGLGYGFIGEFSKPIKFIDLERRISRYFGCKPALTTGVTRRNQRIKRMGFVPGKGSSFVSAAARARCDLFLTGETGYHTSIDGLRCGVAVVEIGHTESERAFLTTVSGWMREAGIQAFPHRESRQKRQGEIR